MINITQIVLGVFARAADWLKFKSPRWWAVVGALFVAIETLLLSGLLPFADKIPVMVTEILVGIALIFTNSSSSDLANGLLPTNQSVGTVLDTLLAKGIEKVKAGNMTVFAYLQILFGALKFYIMSDPTLDWPQLLVNAVLSVAMLFTIPRTKPILAKLGFLKAAA